MTDMKAVISLWHFPPVIVFYAISDEPMPLKVAPNGHLVLFLFDFKQQQLAFTSSTTTEKVAKPGIIKEIRSLARETKGPWVAQES